MTEPPPRPLVTIDDRETRSGLPEAVAARWPRVAVGRLAVGDIEIEGDVTIERKTVSDFVASLRDGRLRAQAYALGGYAWRRLLIVEGRDVTDWMAVHPNSLRNMLLSLLVGYRVPLLRTDDVEETAEVIAILARHAARRGASRYGDTKKAAPRVPRARVAAEMLGAIPGVGDRRASQLLTHFGSVQSVLAADEKELRDADGIGRATARAVRSADAGPDVSASPAAAGNPPAASARGDDASDEPPDLECADDRA